MSQSKTDPRSESIMWIFISCPIVYAVSKQGFNISTGSSAIIAALWGAGLWSMQTRSVADMWTKVHSLTQTKAKLPDFTVYVDTLNQ
jgi:hypothetical protein